MTRIGVPKLIRAVFILAIVLGAQDVFAERGSITRGTYQPWTMPGISISSPSGYGADWGDVFIGGGFTHKTRAGNDSDGAFGVGGGFGDPQKYVGVEVSVSITDVSGFERGGFSAKIHRQLPKGFSVAAGREFLATWGDNNDRAKSWYGAVSKVFWTQNNPNKPFSAVTLTAGAGNGRFRSETAFLADDSTIGIFGSAAVRILQPLAFIADWTGQDLALGLSITPLRKYALFINPGLTDITGNTRNGAKFIVSAGFAYDFNKKM